MSRVLNLDVAEMNSFAEEPDLDLNPDIFCRVARLCIACVNDEHNLGWLRRFEREICVFYL